MKAYMFFLFLISFTVSSCSYQAPTIPPNTNIKIEFYKNGNVKSIKKYDDTTHITEVTWFDSSGSIQSIQRMKDTTHEGTSIWFYKNGNTQNTVIFKTGNAVGNAFIFYEDGSLQTHQYWKNNKLVGFTTNYYDDSIGLIKNIYRYDDSGNLIGIKEASAPGNHPQAIPIDSVNKRAGK